MKISRENQAHGVQRPQRHSTVEFTSPRLVVRFPHPSEAMLAVAQLVNLRYQFSEAFLVEYRKTNRGGQVGI